MVRNLTRLGSVCATSLLVFAGSAFAQDADRPDAPAPVDPKPAPQPAPADAPNLVFERTTHSFGRIHDVEDVKTTFKFKNTGLTTLILEKPKAKCGCTVPDLEKLEFAPGEEGTMDVIFHPQGKHGEQSQPITINSNDPDEPSRVIYIEASVRHLIHLDPPMLNFGPVVKGESKSMIVRVSGSEEAFEAWHATATNRAHFGVKVLGTGESEVDGEKMRTTEVEVTVRGTDELGELGGDLTIRTNEARQRLVSIKVGATVVGDIRVVPEKLALGMLMVQSSFERTIKVSSRGGTPFEILGIRSNSNLPGAVEFETKPSDDSKTSYDIILKAKSPEAASPVRGVILISTSSPDQSEIRIPFYGVAQAEGDPSGIPGDPTPPAGNPGGDSDAGGGR